MPRIVSLKFRDAGKHYHFNALDFELAGGDKVVVETDRGRAMATVVAPPEEVAADAAPEDLKSILRMVTDEDLAMAQGNIGKEKEAFAFCQERIQKRAMEMKLVRTEYLFDGSKIIFYFTADGRVDFRELVKDLAHYFHTRIEMRQIGVRDEAKLIGGLGICGRELCCCSFLTEFSPVSVRMAKEQGLALNPTKISGQCGRLLCCLSYEFETYCHLKKALPKCGRKVQLNGVKGEIVSHDVLRQKVVVRLEDGHTVQATADQIEEGKSPPPGLTPEEPARRLRVAQPPPRKTVRPPEEPPPPAKPPKKPAEPATATAPEPTDESAPHKTSRKRSRSRRRPRNK